MPKVSIIIPTHNRAQDLKKCLESVLAQTYQDFEIIVVDDASEDNTSTVISALADQRIKYICREKKGGAAAARNTGIGASKAEFVAFQDDDDVWLPDKLKKQMAVFERSSPEVGVVYCGFLRIKDKAGTYYPHFPLMLKKPKLEGQVYRSLLYGNFVSTQTAVVRRACFSKVGIFDQAFPPLEDWELFLRLSKHYTFKYIAEPLVLAPISKTSISTNKGNDIKARQAILKKYAFDLRADKKLLALHYFNLGELLLVSKRFDEARAAFIAAVEAQPYNLRYRIHLWVAFIGARLKVFF